MRKLLPYQLLFIFIFPVSGICQIGEYSDAKNPSQALGFIMQSIWNAEIMLSECSAKFGNLQQEFEEKYNQWSDSEATVIRKAKYTYSIVKGENPDVVKVQEHTEKMQKDLIAKLYDMPGDVDHQGLLQYCQKYFSDLASGVGRLRRPRVYEYVDNFNENTFAPKKQ